MSRQLEQTQALLGLLAQREAKLQVALQLQGLTQQAQLLRVQELLADLSTPEQPAPPTEPLLPEILAYTVDQPVETLLPRRPDLVTPEETLEELEPMPPAEEQLSLRLGPSSTLPSFPSSGS